MTKDKIRFHKITKDPELVAVAEVPLFPGVYLRGWHVKKKGGEIEILPPHKVYSDPASGKEEIFPLLYFTTKDTHKRWINKVKEEYLKWAQMSGPST